eukprot:TRINITY_DN999_c0_g1_i1.p2 TRINITY_DN999_c0_g1~~TRINITY_DN999_c0_g1_i1.p2  ORF type:complete len:530 (-),score=95.45 TRINITY_DN999_c0_g1_i1:13876-15426(-)
MDFPKLNKKEVSTDPSQFLADEEEEIDFSKVDKAKYDQIKKRQDEYRKAATYLMNNGLFDQSKAIIKKIDHLKSCLDLIVKGKNVDLLKIEPPLTSEILFGIPHQERINAFQEILTHLQKQLIEVQALAKSPKKDKTSLAAAQKKYTYLTTSINTLKELMKNEWAPVPVYHFETDIAESSVVQKEVGLNEILLEYYPDPKMAKKQYYRMFYKLKGAGETAQGVFEAFEKKKIKIPFPKGFKNIHECTLSLELKGRMYLLFKPVRAQLKAKLSALETSNTVEFDIPEKRGKYNIRAIVKIRAPTNGNTTKTVETKELVLDKVYPPFKQQGESGIRLVKTTASAGSEVKQRPKEIKKQQKAASQAVTKAQPKGDPPLPKSLDDLPSGVREIDVKDPDDVGNLICASYLEKKIATYTSVVKQLSEKGQKVPDQLREKLAVMVRNNAAIKGQIDAGKLTPQVYKQFLQAQLEKDHKLLGYLEKIGQKQKAAMVKDRMQCLIKEIKSLQHLIRYINNNKLL